MGPKYERARDRQDLRIIFWKAYQLTRNTGPSWTQGAARALLAPPLLGSLYSTLFSCYSRVFTLIQASLRLKPHRLHPNRISFEWVTTLDYLHTESCNFLSSGCLLFPWLYYYITPSYSLVFLREICALAGTLLISFFCISFFILRNRIEL